MMYFFVIASVLAITSMNLMAADISQREIADTLKRFPVTVSEIISYKNDAVLECKKSIKAYKTQSKNQLSFDQTILGWHRIIEALAARLTVLSFSFLITDDIEVQAKANEEAKKLHVLLQNACTDSEALALCLKFGDQVIQNPSLLTPAERYAFSAFISGISNHWPETTALGQKALQIQEKLMQEPLIPFTFIKGDAEDKILSSDGKVTVLSWNVCIFNYGMSMLFGGILPWQERIEEIANAIKNVDADLVCLQEVFSQEAGIQLQQRLKQNYGYFYINIGPRLFGFDYNGFGIPSGLFVASKYPLDHPTFTSYNEEQTPKNRGYGFFTADLKNKEKVIARIASTHLNPGSGQENVNYREAQLQAILSHLRVTDVLGIPSFLCGDLNIEKESDEFKNLLVNFVYSDSRIEWTCCELRNYWWKAQQDVKKFTALGLELEWLDYCLRLKSGMKKFPSMTSAIISVNNLKDPKSSLSDHQMLLTILNFN